MRGIGSASSSIHLDVPDAGRTRRLVSMSWGLHTADPYADNGRVRRLLHDDAQRPDWRILS
jgi:hypothetical protein